MCSQFHDHIYRIRIILNNFFIASICSGIFDSVTEKGITALSTLTKLEEIYFYEFKNLTVETFIQFPKLKKISCYNCKTINIKNLCDLVKISETIEEVGVDFIVSYDLMNDIIADLKSVAQILDSCMRNIEFHILLEVCELGYRSSRSTISISSIRSETDSFRKILWKMGDSTETVWETYEEESIDDKLRSHLEELFEYDDDDNYNITYRDACLFNEDCVSD